MSNVYLSDKQKDILKTIASYLKNNLLSSQWHCIFVHGNSKVSEILWLNYHGKNPEALEKVKGLLTAQDFRDFAEYGLCSFQSPLITNTPININKRAVISFVENGFKFTETTNQGLSTMSNCYLTDKQKRMLASIVSGLKNGSVAPEWQYVPGDGRIMAIFGLDDKGELWRNHWNGVTLADFQAYIDCGLFAKSSNTSFILREARIIAFVENDFKFDVPQAQQPSQIFNFHGGISGQGISIGNILNHSTQSIQVMTGLGSQQRDELESLVKQLQNVLETVPEENKEDAEATAEQAARLIEDVNLQKKSMIKISAQGLIAAATNLATIAPSVLSIAQKIVDFINSNLQR